MSSSRTVPTPGTDVLVYFSGHGSRIPDPAHGDEKGGLDSTLLASDRETTSSAWLVKASKIAG